MPKTLIKSRLHFNKNRQKPNHHIENIQSQLPPILQMFKQNVLSWIGFLIYNWASKVFKKKIMKQLIFQL